MLAPNVCNSILINPALIVSLTSFINKPHSTSYFTIAMVSFPHSKLLILLYPIQTFFYGQLHLLVMLMLLILSGIKTLKINVLNTFFIKGNPVSSNGPKGLPKKPLIVLFYAIEFLIVLYQLRNYLQQLYETLKLVYYLITIFAENYSHHFLFQILIY